MASHEQFKQAELFGGQIDAAASSRDTATQQVQLQVSHPQRGGLGSAATSTKNGPHSGQQFCK